MYGALLGVEVCAVAYGKGCVGGTGVAVYEELGRGEDGGCVSQRVDRR